MTTTATEALYDLLAVIADPVAHKARLDELVAQETKNQGTITTLHEMANETVRLNNTAKATNIVADNLKAALDAREAEIDERARQLDLATSALKKTAEEGVQKFRQRDADLAKRETAVSQREASLSDRETAVKEAEASAAALTEKVQRQAAAVQVALTS